MSTGSPRDPLFNISHRDSSTGARTGNLLLPHGRFSTPVFMPVGTNAAVKALTVDDLKEIGFKIILANTYHLYLRPGAEVIAGAGGLHQFMNWERNILTDSGGFQVFSLALFRKIRDEGVEFRSHIDGSLHRLSPEQVVELQCQLGSDIQMQLDVCTPAGISYKKAGEALRVTDLWLDRSVKAWRAAGEGGYRGLFFPVIQGNFFKDLRERSIEAVVRADTPGIAIGGLSVGEEPEVFREYLSFIAGLLPDEKPRYVMGVGTPGYILESIAAGIDMFDCVLPTRTGRNGLVFTRHGPLSLKKLQNRMSYRPLDKTCGCKVCRRYSRAYLRHLFKTREILCSMLASYHNLYFLHQLVEDARTAIVTGCFGAFKDEFLARYNRGDTEEEGD